MKVRLLLAVVGIGVTTGIHSHRPSETALSEGSAISNEEPFEYELNKAAFDVQSPIDVPVDLAAYDASLIHSRDAAASKTATTPEPATMAALAAGSALLFIRRKRQAS